MSLLDPAIHVGVSSDLPSSGAVQDPLAADGPVICHTDRLRLSLAIKKWMSDCCNTMSARTAAKGRLSSSS